MQLIIAISFDDCYLDHVGIARLLLSQGIKATFYITTNLRKWVRGTTLATKPEAIAEIADMGHEIGSHTCTHRDLTILSIDEIEYELKFSKKFLEDVTGREVLGIAYPWGRFDNRVLMVARKYYEYGRTTEFGLGKLISRYAIPARAYLAFQNLPKLFIKALISKGSRKRYFVIYTHEAQPLKMLTVIKFLRSVASAKFVTVKELVQLMFNEYYR